jgi:hypothetical protein
MPFPEEDPQSLLDLPSLVHDLRQPLSNIEACTSLLRIYLDETEDGRIQECLDRIDGQVEAITRILVEATKPVTPPAAV